MSVVLHLAVSSEVETIIPILKDADEDEGRMRALLTDGMHSSYTALDGEQLVGAASMRWEEHESEIEYIAVASDLRGHGYGKAIIAALFAEARERRVRSILVGTANSGLDAIAFYQKCGFRMDHVRRDFFHYIQPPMTENGIPMLDMLMLRYEVR